MNHGTTERGAVHRDARNPSAMHHTGATAAGAVWPRIRALASLSLVRTLRPGPLLLGGLLTVLPIGFALLFRGDAAEAGALSDFLRTRYSTLVVAMLIPLTALVTAAGPMSAEREDGTVLYQLTTTTSRTLMVMVRWGVATLLTSAVALLAVFGTGLAAAGAGVDATGLIGAFALGSVVGAALYSAIFLAMAVAVPRALLMGLLYVLIWEGAVIRLFSGARYLSARQILLGITRGAAPEAERGADVFSAALPTGTAVIWAGVMLTVALGLAIRQMRRLSVAKAS